MGFSIKESNTTKGLAVLLLLFHHIFYDTFCLGIESNQVFFFGPITAILTRYGSICIFIFASLSGYGIYKSLKKSSIKETIVKRETKLLGIFIPVYIIFALLFVILEGFEKYLLVYGYGEISLITVLFRIVVNAIGFSSIFHTPSLNSAWWYYSAAHLIFFILPLIIEFAKRNNLKNIILIISIMLAAHFQYEIPTSYFCLLASYIGFCIGDSKILDAPQTISNFVVTAVLTAVVFFVSICIKETQEGYFVFSLVGPLFIIFEHYVLSRIAFVSDVLSFIGKHSGIIYITHSFFREIFMAVNSFVYSFSYAFISFGIVFVLSLLTSIVFSLLMKTSLYKSFVSKLQKHIEILVL